MDGFKIFLDWCWENLGLVVAIILAFFEITPIKFHPIRSILKWIGHYLNADIEKKIEATNVKVDALDKKVDGMQEESDINEMDRIRWEILDFANSCRNGRRHTKEEFDHVIKQEKKYTMLLEKTHTENGVFTLQFQYIIELYNKCIRENSFLA